MHPIELDLQEQDYPAYLGDAVSFIMTNLENTFQLNDVAAAASVSERTLHLAFQANFGVPVMAFVRHRRLELAYRQLLAADENSVSVTVVALSSGFQHLGRFSSAYREYFNELPSETLKRRSSKTPHASSFFERLSIQHKAANRAAACISCRELPTAWFEKPESNGNHQLGAA